MVPEVENEILEACLLLPLGVPSLPPASAKKNILLLLIIAFVCSFLECPAYRPLLRTACYCESLRLTKKVKKNNFFECKFSSTRRTRCFSNSLRLKNPSKKNSFLKDVYHFWTNVSTIKIFCNSFRMTNMSFGMNYISLLLYMRTMKN